MLAGAKPICSGDAVAVGADGFRITMETAEMVKSATLVAIILTGCCEEMVAGAVYTPVDEIEPTAGLVDQLTAEFAAPVTVAAKTCACEG